MRNTRTSQSGIMAAEQYRERPYFMLHTAVIDKALGTEAVAVYVFIMAYRRTTTEAIAEHFGMSDLAVEFALQDLRSAGLLDEES